MDAEKVSKAIKDGNLNLVSSTGFSIPVTQKPKPRISKNWDFEMSFDELCAICKYCFRFPDSKSRDNRKPHFVISETDLNGDKRIVFVSISNDAHGVTVSSVGSTYYSRLLDDAADISKEPRQMVLDYLRQTNAADLIVS